jgi:hypothetical protein
MQGGGVEIEILGADSHVHDVGAELSDVEQVRIEEAPVPGSSLDEPGVETRGSCQGNKG